MIFEYYYTGAPQDYLIFSEILPPTWVGFALLLASPLGIVWFWNSLRRQRVEGLDSVILLTCSIAILGIYIFSFRWIDEVFVNLEHPYNLLHHGRFSYSPNSMVEGTVEYVYYLLMTPFAWTKGLLVQAGYVQGFVVAWLHLFVLWKILGRKHYSLKFFLLLIFSLALPLIHIFANGFGNSLISLLLLIAIYFQLNDKPNRALWIAALFPLIRPDALLYSFAIFFVDAITRRKLPWKYFLGAIASSLTYMSLVKLFYGTWVPTPVSFKSFKLSMIPLIDWMEVWNRIQFWILNPFHILFLVALVASFFLPISAKIRQLRLYTIPLFGIFMLYTITTISFLFFMLYDGRYFVGFELFAIAFPLLLVWDVLGKKLNKSESEDGSVKGRWRYKLDAGLLSLQWNVKPSPHSANLTKQGVDSLDRVLMQRQLSSLVCLGLVALYLPLAHIAFGASQPTPWHSVRTDWLAVSGQITDRVVPRDWTISNTELNSFGFSMSDRDVIDLWGYTNEAIAHSKICNEMKIRNNPDFFLQANPDVFAWWFISWPGSNYERRLQGSSMGKSYNQLGDLNQVLPRYDVFFLNDPNYQRHLPSYATQGPRPFNTFEGVTLLIKKEHTQEFMQILEREKFQMINTRELDMQVFRERYDAQPLVTHFCG